MNDTVLIIYLFSWKQWVWAWEPHSGWESQKAFERQINALVLVVFVHKKYNIEDSLILCSDVSSLCLLQTVVAVLDLPTPKSTELKLYLPQSSACHLWLIFVNHTAALSSLLLMKNRSLSVPFVIVVSGFFYGPFPRNRIFFYPRIFINLFYSFLFIVFRFLIVALGFSSSKLWK